ncbi:MAG: hypothetical protein AAF533_20495 [Acidobacteriota bacterium]
MIDILKALVRFEWMRLSRSRMRASAILVFFACGLYAIASGQHHVSTWKETLDELTQRETTQREQALAWFSAGRTGPEGRTWIDVSQARWADRYASAHAVMEPEPLAALAIGLSDIRATWATVSGMGGARPFQTADPATLGNAEKLLAGNFDLAFVFAYLLPLLLLVLLFDVGGLERDLGMMRMVRVQSVSPRSWLLLRAALPIVLVAMLALLLCVVGGLWSGAIGATFGSWSTFTLLVLGYTCLWGALFAAVLAAGTGVSAAALWMVGLWLGFCVVVPAAVRQVVGQEHPSLYASELTTAMRAERYEILLGDVAEHEPAFYQARPNLPTSEPSSRASGSTRRRIVQQAAFLDIVGDVTQKMSSDEIARETAVARWGWVNPAYVLQRALCGLAGTESVSFRAHRDDVFTSVTSRLDALVGPTWNEQPFTLETFEGLFEHGLSQRYGLPPRAGTWSRLLVLLVIAVVAFVVLATMRGKRERQAGVI